MSETELVVWGSNSSSVLSKSSTSSIANPQALSLPYPITKMSAGDKHVAFITRSG
jgi:alpha-tubulin suppressor-like RCC1 family protein